VSLLICLHQNCRPNITDDRTAPHPNCIKGLVLG